MRIDTHPGNIPMQKALKKAGFQQCGTIVLAEGSEKGDLRIALKNNVYCLWNAINHAFHFIFGD